MSHRPPHPKLELLEARVAPASFGNSTLTYRDVDGDTVTVTLTRPLPAGTGADSVFAFDTGTATDGNTQSAQVLQRVNLTGFPNGTGVTVVAKDATTGKPSTADVGWIDGTGIDLGTVRVAGDLGRVTAGAGGSRGTGLAALDVGSLGARGTATQAAGGTLDSVIQKRLGTLNVAGDINTASVFASQIGSIAVGGSLRGGAADGSGSVSAYGSIGAVTIRGGLVGGPGASSATIVAGQGSIGAVKIGGDVVGGPGDGSASIRAFGQVEVVQPPDPNPYDYHYPPPIIRWTGGRIASVAIGGSVTGQGPDSASILADNAGALGPVTIRGDLTGGGGPGSASVRAAAYTYTSPNGRARTFGGTIASVTVGQQMTGGGDVHAGSVVADRSIGSVKLGALAGGGGTGSGAVLAGGNVGSVTVSGFTTGTGPNRVVTPGDVRGGSGAASGAVWAGAGRGAAGSLGAVQIAGDLRGGAGAQSGTVRAAGFASVQIHYSYSGPYGPAKTSVTVKQVGGQIASVAIGGSLAGGTGAESGTVAAVGSAGPPNGGTARGTIGAVRIAGDLQGGAGPGARAGAIWAEGSAVARPSSNPYAYPPPFQFGGTIASVTVGGSVQGNGSPGGASVQADRSIGRITVGQNWTAGSISAGFRSAGFFDPATVTPTGLIGTIGAIRVGGTVAGTAAPSDAFAFVASKFTSVSIGGKALALKGGPGDDDIQLDPANADFRLVELSAAGP